MSRLSLSRRGLLAGLGSLALVRPGLAIDATEFGVAAETPADQTAAMQAAMLAAQERGQALILPPGQIFVGDLEFPGEIRIVGQKGSTMLVGVNGQAVGKVFNANDLVIEGVGFSSQTGGSEDNALLSVESSLGVRLIDCSFTGGAGTGLAISDAELIVERCDFSQIGDTAIFARNSRGIIVRDCRIADCGNGGIRIWRDEPGTDGSLVTGNTISRIDWRGGGNGQNGNGVNVFRANGVIVSDNHFADCSFTAVRINSADNSQIIGNSCERSGEVAIFSEFAFSGSIIANNLIDGAATGISMTNLDQGGHLAVCTGNIVRNITASSAVNPDTRPTGIFAEADAVVSGNAIQNVPGPAIAAGYGPFLRNVVVSDNVATDVRIGVAVSVVTDPPPGAVSVTDNILAVTEHGIVGMAWEEMVTDDLARDAGQFAHVHVEGNVVTR